MAVIRSIETLEVLFIKNKRPYWKLYAKAITKGTLLDENCSRDEGRLITDLEQSWEALSETIQMFQENGDGVFKIQLYGAVGSKSEPITLTYTSVPQAAGINGINGGGVSYVSGYSKKQFDEELEARFAGFIESYTQQQEIKRLKQELKEVKEGGNGSKIERVIGAISEKFMNKYLSDGGGGSVNRAVSGTGQQQSGTEQQQQQETEEGGGGLDMNTAVNLAFTIKEALPNVDTNLAMSKLAQYIESNPDQAAAFLNTI